MNIVGFIIFIVLGTIVIVKVPKVLVYKKETDYSEYPVAIGTVNHTQDFCGDRWIVCFMDETGREVLGMDDIISYGTFSPEKYHIPKFGTKEKIFFWKDDSRSYYAINGKRVEYNIHFCNEDLYNLQRIKGKRSAFFAVLFGLFLITCGFLIYFKG